MGNVQISQELFMQLLRFHLVEDGSCEKEIKQGLEKKLLRQRKNGNGREKSIWTDVECRRVSDGNSSLVIRTGAWHAPVKHRQGEIWKGESCNERRKIRL